MQVRVVRLLCRATLLFFLVWAWPAHGADLPNTKGWIELHTQNFSVFSNASSGKTQKLATDLERFREVLGLITKGFDLEASVPTSVFVFKNGASMLPYKLDASGKPMNVAGYFMERPFRNYILLDASAESSQSRVIYHEYVHSMLHETFGHIPQWLNEGLAEYYSTFRFNNLSNTAWVGDPIDSHVYQLRRNALMGLDRLFSITTRSPEYNEATMQGTFYAQALRLIERYNEAVNLMNAGEAERALAILEAELTDCGPSENCDRLREFREQVSSWIERSRRIERFNEAVALLQAGKRKAAIAILQELEGEAADEELQQRARDLLDELGAR